MSEPTLVKVMAVDVKPYLFGLWCTVGNGEPRSNVICSVKWSEDGQRLWFMLESHNFFDAAPDEALELVPQVPSPYFQKVGRDFVLPPRPPITKPCEHCNGKGVVQVSR